MKNPNPFIPEGSFLEQKNKARARLRIAVFFSISLSVMVLMALLIQGCRKNDTGQEEAANTSNPPPELPTNPPESNPTATAPPTETAPTPPPAVTPPPVAPPPAAPPVAEGQEYTVVKGDTFATIAKKSGVSVKALETANPGVDAKKLQIGQKLHVPAPTSATTAAPMAAPGATEMASAGGEQTYKVKSGDTLIGIAKQFLQQIQM